MISDPVAEQQECGREDYEVVDGEMRSEKDGGEEHCRITQGQ